MLAQGSAVGAKWPAEFKVSVLMPVYNSERFLREAVDSILNQTFRDFEFIIVDDGSTDGTGDILGSYTDPRIRIIHNGTNLGITASLNKGLDTARGEYIARMDHDDISEPERLAKQVAYMDENPNVVASGTWARDIDADGHETGQRCVPAGERMRYEYWRPSPIVHPSAILRVSQLGDARYDANFDPGADFEFWLRLKADHDLGNVPEFLLRYRVHADSITSLKRPGQIDSSQKAVYQRLGLKVSAAAFQHLMGSRPDLNPISRWLARRRLARAIHIPYRHYRSEDLAYAWNWLCSRVFKRRLH
jgi:glycosyltransferase involved in cell wall biosynthesis